MKKNSRAIIEMETQLSNTSSDLTKMRITQISGLLARRCKPYVKVGQEVARGSRVGVIIFGSLVKFEIEDEALSPTIQIGQKVKAGKTVILRHQI